MFRSEKHIQWLGFLVFLVPGCGQDVPVAVESTDVSAVPIQQVSSTKAPEPPMMPLDPAKIVPIQKLPTRKGLAAIGSAIHDFGDIQQKAELRHDFVLTNEADVPIRIVGMQSSCSCTWAENNDEFVGSLIEPNQKIDFPLFIHTGTLQDKANGKITIAYRFQGDSPFVGGETFTLEVKGTILPDYRIEPWNIDLGEVRALESQTAKAIFRVTPVQLESLEILSIKPSSKLLTTKILSSGKEGYEIEVTFDGASQSVSDIVTGNLIIETNSKIVPRGIVHISARYYTPVDFSQTEIIVSSEEMGTVKKQIQIYSSVTSQIRKIDAGSSGFVKTEFDAEQKTDQHTVTVSIAPCRDTEIEEKITLEIVFFPAGGESMTQIHPVTIYRFYKGEKL